MVAEYAAGALRAPAVGLLRMHLAACNACADRLRDNALLVDVLRRATDVPMPEDARTRLRELLASIGDP